MKIVEFFVARSKSRYKGETKCLSGYSAVSRLRAGGEYLTRRVTHRSRPMYALVRSWSPDHEPYVISILRVTAFLQKFFVPDFLNVSVPDLSVFIDENALFGKSESDFRLSWHDLLSVLKLMAWSGDYV